MPEDFDPQIPFDDLRNFQAADRMSVEDVLTLGRRRRTRRRTIIVSTVTALALIAGGGVAANRLSTTPHIADPAGVPATAPATTSPATTPSAPTANPSSPTASGTRTQVSPSAASTSAASPRSANSPSATVTLAASDVLTTEGIGGFRLHASVSGLAPGGYATYSSDNSCPGWRPTQKLENQGVGWVGEKTIDMILLNNPQHPTASGARVGMTFGQVKQLYGNRARLELKDGVGGKHQVLTVVADGREIAFMPKTDTPKTSIADTDKVDMIVLQDYNSFLGWDGC